MSRSLSADRLLSVIEQAMHDGDLSDADMRRVAVDWLSKRRPWATMFLNQVARRLAGRAAESHAEVRVGDALKAAGVFGLSRQHEIKLPGYGRARFDLAVPTIRWAIEVDAHPSHESTSGRLSDRRRDVGAASLGWLVTRLSRSDYDHAFDTAIAELVAVFHARRSDFR